jgi:hypothetical protein
MKNILLLDDYFSSDFIDIVEDKLSPSPITGFYYIEEIKFIFHRELSNQVPILDYNFITGIKVKDISELSFIISQGYMWFKTKKLIRKIDNEYLKRKLL